MKRIFFVRHGESQANVMRIFTRSPEGYPLTERGVEQAKRTGVLFLPLWNTAFFSSNIVRAVQTAEIIAEPHGKPVVQLEDFAELDTGCLEGRKNSEETDGYYQHVLQQWIEGNQSIAFRGGEDHKAVVTRAKRGIEEVLKESDEHTAVVISHGGIMTMAIPFLCDNINVDLFYSESKNRFVDNCAVSEVEANHNNGMLSLKLVSWGGVDHLPGDLKRALYRQARL